MSMRGFKLFNNPNTINLMQTMGQSPFPMRGLERFMQKRGMSFQGGNLNGSNLRGPNYPGPNLQGEAGSLSNTLSVQEPTEKRGGIKELLSRFSRNRNK